MRAVARHFENVNIRAAAYIFPLGIFVFYVLAFVGSLSESPGIPGIYLLKLVDAKSKAEVRIGYFGMCAVTSNSTSCANTFMTNSSMIFDPSSQSRDILALLPLAKTIQTKVTIFAPLLLGAILFLCSFVALLELKRRLKSAAGGGGGGKFGGGGGGYSPTLVKTLRSATIMLTVYSLAAAAAAAAGATAALLALRAVSGGGDGEGDADADADADGGDNDAGVKVVGGMAMLALQWLIVVFSALSHFVVSMMFGVRGEVEAAGSGMGGGGYRGGYGGREGSFYD